MDWLTPTRRAVRWSPLLVTFALAICALSLTLAATRSLRSEVLTISSAMIVIGAMCGLHDPGRNLVHALPVSAARRLLQRVIVIVPGLVTALAVVQGAAAVFPTYPKPPGWLELTALATVGLALCALLTRRIGTRAVDAAVSVMVAWVVIAMSAEQLDVPLGLAMPWWRWPVAVTSIALLVVAIATTRGVEA